jgi:nitrite reductase (NADH) small subunit
MRWHQVCPVSRLRPADGVRALVGDRAVAVFRTSDDELYGVGDVDPFCGAAVISRGIVGDRGGEPTVASPMLRQVFSLRTGECMDEPATKLPVYPVRLRSDIVEIGLP